MSQKSPAPPASLASASPYSVPEGGRLVFTYTHYTTDGWARGDVAVAFPNGTPPQVVARNVPVMGGARNAKAVGDWAKIFPEPLPVVPPARAS